MAKAAIRLERFVGIEFGRVGVAAELVAPGLLHLRTIEVPQSLAHRLQALEHGECLLGRPMPRQGDRCAWRAAVAHGLVLRGMTVAKFAARFAVFLGARSSPEKRLRSAATSSCSSAMVTSKARI